MSNSNVLFRSVLVAVLGVGVGSAATAGWSYMHPKLSGGEVEIHNACVMPAEAKLAKVGMKGQEGMSKESEAWSATLRTRFLAPA